MGVWHQELRLRGVFVAAVVCLWFVCGCAGEPQTLAASPVLPIGDQVFSVGYNRIADIYLEPVDMGRLTIEGLNGLRSIDSDLEFTSVGRSVRVALNDRTLAEYPAPEPTDAAAWASLTGRAIERARAYSRRLRDATVDQIYQTVFDGILGNLDTYSRYTGPQRAGSERAQREGYGGLGVTLEIIEGRGILREIHPGGPADRAGVHDGDQLQGIDGEPVASLSIREARDRLRGPIGSVVMLTIGADAVNGRRVTLRRERVIPNTVISTIEKGVGLFKVERFNAATTSNLQAAITTAKVRLGASAHGYVLDLRGNPGGLLDQAVAVADLFIRRGRIISTAGRHPDSWQRFDASGGDILNGMPLVVLIDGRSASASEVVAAALQDSGRAVIVGASSFGKGSVQTVTRLPNDGELFLTWARIYAPSGYTLHRQGVQPTICTSRNQTDATGVLEPLRQGRVSLPAALAKWRAAAPDDETALARLRETCPWKAHEPALDVEVAEQLLADRPLFVNALAMTMVAER